MLALFQRAAVRERHASLTYVEEHPVTAGAKAEARDHALSTS